MLRFVRLMPWPTIVKSEEIACGSMEQQDGDAAPLGRAGRSDLAEETSILYRTSILREA
jgi:hypothetical protein